MRWPPRLTSAVGVPPLPDPKSWAVRVFAPPALEGFVSVLLLFYQCARRCYFLKEVFPSAPTCLDLTFVLTATKKRVCRGRSYMLNGLSTLSFLLLLGGRHGAAATISRLRSVSFFSPCYLLVPSCARFVTRTLVFNVCVIFAGGFLLLSSRSLRLAPGHVVPPFSSCSGFFVSEVFPFLVTLPGHSDHRKRLSFVLPPGFSNFPMPFLSLFLMC